MGNVKFVEKLSSFIPNTTSSQVRTVSSCNCSALTTHHSTIGTQSGI